jgi:hypothetical protein
MRECISISKMNGILALLAFLVEVGTLSPNAAVAQEPGVESAPVVAPKREESTLFDQYSPYLDYGDFNSSEDEDADTLYFQYGRFFGVSVGGGYQGVTGNRGQLYNAALPRFDLRVHYWFDFQFAMSMGIWFATHNFDYGADTYSAKLSGYYADLKYYFDVRNASAPITFANPHLLLGIGAINKTLTSSASSFGSSNDSTLTINFGAGFEFPIVHKKTYFLLDVRYWTQEFQDINNDDFQDRAANLTGGFVSLMGHLMFTW